MSGLKVWGHWVEGLRKKKKRENTHGHEQCGGCCRKESVRGSGGRSGEICGDGWILDLG